MSGCRRLAPRPRPCEVPFRTAVESNRDARLGQRLIKQTVNFDDPGSYHLYFGDEVGRPGTAITFFEWPQAPKGYPGIGGTHHLVVLDLTMPNLDGFSVLEELKGDAHTCHIPVIVVTARDITEAERQRLAGRVEALYQKAALSPRAFVEQVVHVLDVKTGREEDH